MKFQYVLINRKVCVKYIPMGIIKEPTLLNKVIKCNVYKICSQTQLNTRWYANLLNVNLNKYMFRPQSLAIIRLYKRKLIN